MRSIHRRGAAALLAGALATIPATAVVAQDSALEQAVDAVGGAEALGSLEGFVVTASGTRNATDEGPSPGGPAGLGGAYESTVTVDTGSGDMRVEYAIAATEFGAPREVAEVVTGDVGFVDGQNSIVAPPGVGPLLSDRVESIRTHQQLLNPHLLLLDALADPSVATSSEGGIEIAHGSTPITLALDADSGVITSASTMESDPLRRDVELVVTYDDWSETASGVSFPGSITVTYDGEVVQQETRSVSTDAAIDDARFAIPEGVSPSVDPALVARGDVNHQYLQNFAAIGFPLDGRQTFVAGAELAPGIFHVTGGSHHSMAIVQDDGVVLVEAPLDETRTAAILDWLGQQAPDLPVTHIVQSHHHVDHSAGLRSMAGRTGATVVAAESAIPFYEASVFGASSEIVPDGVDGDAIETLGVGAEPVTIGSGTNPVTVYAFPNPHAEDYVLVEAGGALWVVDIYNPGLGFGAPPPALFDWVASQGLELTQLVGGHGGTDMWADLVAAQG